jgi:tetratricopeptide (TPR) repeat protein
MKIVPIRAVALALCVGAGPLPLWADSLSELPAQWQGRLVPVEDADISGAERLMREAITEARQATAELLSAAPAPDPDALAGAYGRLGALLLLTEVEAQADACFRNARTLQPQEFRWPYYAGYLAMMAGNTDPAEAYLLAAQAIDPDYPPLYLRLGKVWLDRSELAKARAAFERVVDRPGLMVAASYYLGQIANLERRYDDAVAHLEAALAADPAAKEVHYPLGQAYQALGKNDLARDHLSRFEARIPVAEDPLLEQMQGAAKRSLPAFQKALHAVRQGDYPAAAGFFAEGLAVDPDNVPARVSHARVLFLSGRRDEAERELAAALAADPDQHLANFLRGVLLQDQGRNDEAAAQYRRTLALDPRHAGARFYLANLDLQGGRFAAAADGYRATLAADPDTAPARLLELVARKRSGEPEGDIIRAVEGLCSAEPTDSQLSYARARLLAGAADKALRDPARALEIARELVRTVPVPPHLRALALAQAANGDFERALQTQQQAIAMAAWMASPGELELMQGELAAIERRELPAEAWPEGDPLLAPPPFDAVAPFRDYPAAVPY